CARHDCATAIRCPRGYGLDSW
nr:immunoglobulin heavy chain junction region [Macaca mulatta]MOX39333.1 immunoglobulin heavy chain junction region [Macaca mulatta]MOX39344.1 immunoglobulin heavy chain junction region [Macaca mulatta]MOX39709.1 immunoglobulin heavy chain junction region [Macaca mulatta]MOX40010.1 immunoglobulin heavy chain junction region [Macaca mulatta]